MPAPHSAAPRTHLLCSITVYAAAAVTINMAFVQAPVTVAYVSASKRNGALNMNPGLSKAPVNKSIYRHATPSESGRQQIYVLIYHTEAPCGHEQHAGHTLHPLGHNVAESALTSLGEHQSNDSMTSQQDYLSSRLLDFFFN